MSRIAVSASSSLIKSNTDARAFATTLIQPQSGFLGGRHVNNYAKKPMREHDFVIFSLSVLLAVSPSDGHFETQK